MIGTLADSDCEEELDRPIWPIHDSDGDRRHPPSTFSEGSHQSDSSPDSSHRVPYDSCQPLSSFSSDGESPRQSPYPEVHRVRSDSPIARPPILIAPTSTQLTTAKCTAERPTAEHPTAEHPTVEHPTVEHPASEHPASIHVPREAIATPFDLGAATDDRGLLEALNDVADGLYSALIPVKEAPSSSYCFTSSQSETGDSVEASSS